MTDLDRMEQDIDELKAEIASAKVALRGHAKRCPACTPSEDSYCDCGFQEATESGTLGAAILDAIRAHTR